MDLGQQIGANLKQLRTERGLTHGLDMVAALFGGSSSGLSRLVYILVCVAALWCITLFFREDRVVRRPAA